MTDDYAARKAREVVRRVPWHDMSLVPLIAQAIREAQAEALERAARSCDDLIWMDDIDWWRSATKKEVSARSARECAAAIRALTPTPAQE